MKKDSSIYYDEMLYDDRIYSKNPKDWDNIKDLNIYYVGYFDLPNVYTVLREKLPVQKQTTFFLDGFFIKVHTTEKPADVYIKYLKQKETQKKYYDQWKKNISDATFYNLERTNWESKISYEIDANTTAIEKITPIFLMFLQKKIKNTKIKKEDLYSAYKKAICNNKEIERQLNFDVFISSAAFAKLSANWKHISKIGHFIKNAYLKTELKQMLNKKIQLQKKANSVKWYKKYYKYNIENKNIKKDNVYNLKLSGFSKDTNDTHASNRLEQFTILKDDLFNPNSIYNIRHIISAALNRYDFTSHNLDGEKALSIYDKSDKYKITFSYGQTKENTKNIFNGGKKHSKEVSVYSIPDEAFLYIAMWQKKLRLAAIKKYVKNK